MVVDVDLHRVILGSTWRQAGRCSAGETRRMTVMAEMQELIEAPLSREDLVVRYRDLCTDPAYNRVPGKIEIDLWGRLVMTPPSFYHGRMQGRVIQALQAIAGGEVM